jgi:hypothetical protein
MALRRPDSRPGDAVGEAAIGISESAPAGSLERVRILRETLVIDLRPLERLRPAVVEATYRVRNDGETQNLSLIFIAMAVSPQMKAGSSVWRGGEWVIAQGDGDVKRGAWLDDRPLDIPTSEDTGEGHIPKEWEPPATTPGLEPGKGALPYKANDNGDLFGYLVNLPPGEHTLRVRYAARPSAYCDDRTHAIYWQLGYVLAPARDWAGFGGLDAKVLLPAGWRAAASPEMRREGAALVGAWDSLPADSLAVTAQTDRQAREDSGTYWTLLIILSAAFTALAFYAGWKAGDWLGRRRRTSAWALLVSPLVAVALLALASLAADLIARPRAPEQACFNEIGNYDFLVTFFLALIIIAWHFVSTQAAAFIARRRLK